MDARTVSAGPEELWVVDKAVQSAQDALDAGTAWFQFRALPREQFRALVAEHPPADADVAAADAAGQDRPDFGMSFAPALIAASAGLDPAVVDGIYASPAWTDAELGGLFAAAMAANTGVRALTVRRAK
jgi:hypothetical protein